MYVSIDLRVGRFVVLESQAQPPYYAALIRRFEEIAYLVL